MAGQLNIDEIRNSGILELFVAGALSEEESRRIQLMVKENPELAVEVREIEKSVMKMAASYAQQKPQVNTMYQVLNKIEEEKAKENGKEDKIIEFLDRKERRDLRWLQIAATVALILSFGGNLFLYNELNSTRSEFSSLQQNVKTLEDVNLRLKSLNDQQSDFIALTNIENTKKVPLQNLDSERNNKAFVLYDQKTQNVGMYQWSLEKLSQEEVYQLWAIYGQEVVSLGLLPKGAGSFYFKSIEREPDAFAISVEPAGGSETPTTVVMKGDV